MADPLFLGLGVTLGLLFAVFMVFGPLPKADQVVKRDYGSAYACLTTRFCCLCIALPFYVFVIWMTLVITFHNEKAISIIEQLCPDNYECTRGMALGRDNFNKEACTSKDCGEENLLARSGSQPLTFPRLGLGDNLEPVIAVSSYECVTATSEGCEAAIDVDSKEECTCEAFDNDTTLCLKMVGCDDDILEAIHDTTCTDSDGGKCLKWHLDTDSAKQFSFNDCECTSFDGDVCVAWTCDEFTMKYFYPNIFYAGATTILFIFPALILFYNTLKTQLRKIFRCNELEVYVYSQEAGAINETTAENVATGGYTNEVKAKSKYRTCTMKDVVLLVVAPLVVAFFTWNVVAVSGRVGLAFVGLSGGVIALVELKKFYTLQMTQRENLKKRIDNNSRKADIF